jgi:polysaccharide biosynthesis/export protein VpsN
MTSAMQRLFVFFLLFGMVFCAATHAQTATAAKPSAAQKKAVRDYVLAAGDVISVSVFGQAELSGDFTVSEEGNIGFPLLGAVAVRNLKPKQVEQALVKRLKEGLLVNPKVNVTVKSYRLVYISGQIQQPNGYAFTPGMTVRKLISVAGGFTERASRSRIFVISEGAEKSSEPKKIKLDAQVQPGDIISVEESFF